MIDLLSLTNMKSLGRKLVSVQNVKRCLRDESALALTEFGLVAPVFIGLGVLGLDTANYVITHMRVSQVALQLADNASRVGEQNVLAARRIFESDINDVFIGAEQYADGLDIQTNGRIILSSLERNSQNGQWIHWQRCYGSKVHTSSFGNAGDGQWGTALTGMGGTGSMITASANEAVMFVEIAFDYNAISPLSLFDGQEILYTGAYNVRETRDLSQIHQSNPAAPVSSCS